MSVSSYSLQLHPSYPLDGAVPFADLDKRYGYKTTSVQYRRTVHLTSLLTENAIGAQESNLLDLVNHSSLGL